MFTSMRPLSLQSRGCGSRTVCDKLHFQVTTFIMGIKYYCRNFTIFTVSWRSSGLFVSRKDNNVPITTVFTKKNLERVAWICFLFTLAVSNQIQWNQLLSRPQRFVDRQRYEDQWLQQTCQGQRLEEFKAGLGNKTRTEHSLPDLTHKAIRALISKVAKRPMVTQRKLHRPTTHWRESVYWEIGSHAILKFGGTGKWQEESHCFNNLQ